MIGLCPQDYQKPCSNESQQFVNLTDYVDVILKMHNEPRQRLALGRNMTLPRAARLVVMQWSEELATLASYNARLCQAKYDDCRNTANFKHSGQNIIVSTERVWQGQPDHSVPRALLSPNSCSI